MPSYYYIDLYYDGKFGDVVKGVIQGLKDFGCVFRKATIQERPEDKQHREFVGEDSLQAFTDMAEAFIEDRMARAQTVVSFPTWGRIIFGYDFEIDEDSIDDINAEEEETRTSHTDVGLSFVFTANEGAQAHTKTCTKVTIALWEDYLLSLGKPDTHHYNMSKIIAMLEAVYDRSLPNFGVLNEELHISIDRSLTKLLSGDLPDGNDYTLVGKKHIILLDAERLLAAGLPYRMLSDGGVLIQFRNRWA